MAIIQKLKINTNIPQNDWNLILLIAGSISIVTDEKEYTIEKQSYFYYDKKFEITSTSPYIQGYIISFSKKYVDQYPQLEDYLPVSPSFYKAQNIIKLDSFTILLDTFYKENKASDFLTLNYLTIILLKLKTTDTVKTAPYSKIYTRFVDLIQENIENNYCAGTYAKLLNIPLKRLIKEVKQETNRTPCNIITEQVITKAKKLLLTTDNSSKMIAYQLGFQEPYYFIKYFKKDVGVTPTQYRKEQ